MAGQKRKKILVDSDAWVALAKKNDANHQTAIDIMESLERQSVSLITTNYVFAESVTVISQRVGHKVALRYIASLKQPESSLAIIWISEHIERAAIDIFSRQTSKNISFVDCTNMAVMDSLHVDAIFSFDQIYAKKGYQRVKE